MPTERQDEAEAIRAAARGQARRVRRLKLHAATWGLGTILLTTLWALHESRANGSFRHFGNQGNPGDWNPTLVALGVGVWGLIVGLMALRAHFERPATGTEVEREVERLRASGGAPADAELGSFAVARLGRLGRSRFHVAAWALGMLVVTPLWALIEWQDNGGFERWSDQGNRGDWEPWILPVGGIWALVVALFALKVHFDRPPAEPKPGGETGRRRLHV